MLRLQVPSASRVEPVASPLSARPPVVPAHLPQIRGINARRLPGTAMNSRSLSQSLGQGKSGGKGLPAAPQAAPRRLFAEAPRDRLPAAKPSQPKQSARDASSGLPSAKTAPSAGSTGADSVASLGRLRGMDCATVGGLGQYSMETMTLASEQGMNKYPPTRPAVGVWDVPWFLPASLLSFWYVPWFLPVSLLSFWLNLCSFFLLPYNSMYVLLGSFAP